MKKLKKLLSLGLAAALAVCALTASALAVPANGAVRAMVETGSVTIANAMAGVTYEFFRVFDIDGITADGKSSFVTNDAWDAAVRTLTGFVTVADNGVGSLVTPKEDFNKNTNAKAQEFARAALTAGSGIDPDKTVEITTSGTETVNGLQYGFYVVRSSRAGDETNYTVFTLNTTEGLDITEKNPVYPQIDKTVNSKKTASADFYTDLSYQVVVKAAAGTDRYTITDNFPDELVYDSASLSLKLVLKGQDVSAGRALTADEDYTVTTAADGATGRVKTLTIVLDSSIRNTLKDGDEVIIRYKGQIAANEHTVNGYNNTVELTYSGDPRDSSATVFSGYISFYKHDGRTGANLAGARFVLRKGGQYAVLESMDENAGLSWAFKSWTDEKDAATVITTTGDQTQPHTIRGLDAGTYILEETAAPDGYVKSADTGVTVRAVANDAGEITRMESDIVTIINNPGSQLPDTGGVGTTAFYLAGGALVLCAVILTVVRRRKGA